MQTPMSLQSKHQGGVGLTRAMVWVTKLGTCVRTCKMNTFELLCYDTWKDLGQMHIMESHTGDGAGDQVVGS